MPSEPATPAPEYERELYKRPRLQHPLPDDIRAFAQFFARHLLIDHRAYF